MTTRVLLRLLLLIAAAICLFVALLLALGSLSSGNESAWLAGGLLSYVLAEIVGALPPAVA